MASSSDASATTERSDNRYDCKPSTSRTAMALESDINAPAVDMPELMPLDAECDDGHDEMDSIENEKCSNKLDDDPGIQSLMEISLPSPIPIASPNDECMCCALQSHPQIIPFRLTIIFSIADFNEDNVSSQPPMSPMGILRESPSPNDAKWFEENMHDFSLSSFLGHLDATCDQNAAVAAVASAAAARRCRSPNRCVSSNCDPIYSNLSTKRVLLFFFFFVLFADGQQQFVNN